MLGFPYGAPKTPFNTLILFMFFEVGKYVESHLRCQNLRGQPDDAKYGEKMRQRKDSPLSERCHLFVRY
jgi:hypothetical protein